MSRFKFNLIDRNIRSTQGIFLSDATVEVVSDFLVSNMYLEFKYEYGDKDIRLKAAELKSNAAWSTEEHIGFVRGVFGFLGKDDYHLAIQVLVKELNGEYMIEKFGSRWLEFSIAFKKWYEEVLSPLMQQEVELWKPYMKSNRYN